MAILDYVRKFLISSNPLYPLKIVKIDFFVVIVFFSVDFFTAVTLGADKSLDMSFDYLDGGPEV